jgi:hypothetical protein
MVHMFSYQKTHFGLYILEVFKSKILTIWYVCFWDINFILCYFAIFCVRLYYFTRFGILYQEKSGNPVAETALTNPIHQTLSIMF